MTVIRPSGGHSHLPSGPTSRSGEIVGDIVVGVIATAVGAFLALVVCGLLGIGIANAVGYVAHETGLLQAWEALVAVGEAAPMTPEFFATLIWNNILFGAAAGLVLGLLQFARRWRTNGHRELIETVISPSSLAAASYGVTCLALHVAIATLAGWAAGALFGIFLPSPAALLSGHDAGLVLLHLGADFGGGGFGGGAGEAVIGLLALLIVLVLIVAVAVCGLFAASGWVLFRIAGEGAVGAVASGIGARAIAVLLSSVVARRADVAERDLKEADAGIFRALAAAATNGALHALVYAAVLFAAPALYGIAVVAE